MLTVTALISMLVSDVIICLRSVQQRLRKGAFVIANGSFQTKEEKRLNDVALDKLYACSRLVAETDHATEKY
jgi:hypothetical protein